jgi:hypothetical protein
MALAQTGESAEVADESVQDPLFEEMIGIVVERVMDRPFQIDLSSRTIC